MIGNAIYNKVLNFSTKIVTEKFGNLRGISHLCSAKLLKYSALTGGCSILEHTRTGDNLFSAYPPQWLGVGSLATKRVIAFFIIPRSISEEMPNYRENARISGTSSAQCAGTYSCNNNGLLAPLFGERVGRIFIS